MKLPEFNPQTKYPDWITFASIITLLEFPGAALIGFIRLILIEYVSNDTGFDTTMFDPSIAITTKARNAIAFLIADGFSGAASNIQFALDAPDWSSPPLKVLAESTIISLASASLLYWKKLRGKRKKSQHFRGL
jgi:hypothetical protein